MIEVPELSESGPPETAFEAIGGAPDGHSLDKAARELVAVILDVPETEVSVTVEIDLPDPAEQL